MKNCMEKSEYRALDFFRIICAALVVCIHSNPLSDVNTELSFLFINTVCRIGVPFFFALTGFFSVNLIGGGEFEKAMLSFVDSVRYLYNYVYAILYQNVRSGVWYYIRLHGKCPNRQQCLTAMILLLTNLCVEVVWIQKWLNPPSGFPMSFSILPFAISIFLFITTISVPDKYEQTARYCRKLSTLIYGLHMWVVILISVCERMLGIGMHSTVRYFIIMFITITESIIIIALSKRKIFGKYLKFLY